MKSILLRHIQAAVIAAVALIAPSVSQAAPATLKVSLDSAYVLMGKATPLHIELVADAASEGNLVIPSDSMCGGVEILRMLPADTSEVGSGRMQISREMLLQSFDSGMYVLKPILYIDGRDTVASQRLALKVVPAMVDSLTTIHDYADVRDVKRHLVDYLPDFLADYGLWIIAVIAVGLIGYFLARKYLRRDTAGVAAAAPPEPPYEAALRALNNLKARNLCEQGREKDYYTSLTDILRTYLQRRFGINAMEMTSSQIRSMLTTHEETRPSKQYVDRVLEIADFVKFAKMRPMPEDNIMAFNSALRFIEDTRPQPVDEEADSTSADTDASHNIK